MTNKQSPAVRVTIKANAGVRRFGLNVKTPVTAGGFGLNHSRSLSAL